MGWAWHFDSLSLSPKNTPCQVYLQLTLWFGGIVEKFTDKWTDKWTDRQSERLNSLFGSGELVCCFMYAVVL